MRVFTPVLSFTLGTSTGFFLRDEMTMPTYMRIKVAMMEYYFLSRMKVDPRIIDIIDPE